MRKGRASAAARRDRFNFDVAAMNIAATGCAADGDGPPAPPDAAARPAAPHKVICGNEDRVERIAPRRAAPRCLPPHRTPRRAARREAARSR
eukprot:gene6073-20231_t